VHADIRNQADIDSLPGTEWVIDAAANASVLAGLESPAATRQLIEHNLGGTINLLEYCRRCHAGFILLSTSRVYSIAPMAALEMGVRDNAFQPNPDQPWPVGSSQAGFTESFSTRPPLSLYGSTKLSSEILAQEYGAAFGLPVWINRCGVLAGAGQFGRPDQGIFAYWIHAYARRRPLKFIGFKGQGFQVRDALHPADLLTDLRHQAMDAVSGHSQGVTALSPQQQQSITEFEMALSTAQAIDYGAGVLDAGGATAGPAELAQETTPAFFIGINDPLGGNPLGTAFTPAIFNLFNGWMNQDASSTNFGLHANRRRASIARGEALFNSKLINITGVAGLNDELNLAMIPGTCGTCHDSPNVGNHSLAVALNIGVGELNSSLDLSYLPVFALQNKTTGEVRTTTDPGRALITGLWKDVGKVKGPILRGLAARAPYFHNGSAASLSDVLDFYEKRFNIRFTAQEREDLIAFLNAL